MTVKHLPSLVIAIFVLMCTPQLFAEGTEGVTGVWSTSPLGSKEPHAYVRMYIRDGILYGKVLKTINPMVKDPRCNDCPGWRRNKRVIGLDIVWGLSKGDDSWKGGHIVDTRNGSVYRIRVWREGKYLLVRGYWFIFYRTLTLYPVPGYR